MTPVSESPAAESSKRVLEPVERIAEVLFGLIMVLTFTGTLSVATAGDEDVQEMLIGALGCNLAWGIIDGLLYLMGALAEKGRNLAAYRSVLAAPSAAKAREAIAHAIPPVLASLLETAELDAIHAKLKKLPTPPKYARLGKDDWLGAFAVFLLVFVATLPVTIPFMFMEDTFRAMRASNAVAVTMLFAAGYGYGRLIGRSPWVVGVSMVAIGLAIVALTIFLGG
jgi:VIT1/CCC1 family predicted Fe2+/Mn2+ transporter